MTAGTGLATVPCPACGEPARAGDRFCEACGSELPAATTARCPSCGAPADWVDGYCAVCGARRPEPRDHLEIDLPGVAAVTDRGRRHARNEDAVAVAVKDGAVIAVVCDGVSQSQRPEDASQAAVDAAAAALVAQDDLQAAYDAGRDAALALPYDSPAALPAPSCTFLAATVTDTGVTMAALGDCRGYWYDGDGVRQLTSDDSWAAEAVALGVPADEAYSGPQAHAITRWIGADADPEWRPEEVRWEPPGPGRVLLCSDGLWNYADDDDAMAAAIAAAGAGAGASPLALARHLTTFANEAGGQDNITVVVVDLPLVRPASGTPEGQP